VPAFGLAICAGLQVAAFAVRVIADHHSASHVAIDAVVTFGALGVGAVGHSVVRLLEKGGSVPRSFELFLNLRNALPALANTYLAGYHAAHGGRAAM